MVTKFGKQVTPRKVIHQPVFKDGEFKGVYISYQPQVETDFGMKDLDQLGEVFLPFEEMTDTQKLAYAETADNFDARAIAELGCEAN